MLKYCISQQSSVQVWIRGLHLEGKYATNKNGEGETFTAKTFDDETEHKAKDKSPVTPMKAIHSDIGSSLSRFLLTSPYLLPIFLLSLLLLTTLLVCVGVIRYVTLQRRCYYTRERQHEISHTETRREWVT